MTPVPPGPPPPGPGSVGVVGVGADGLAPGAGELLAGAEVVVGARRHLDAVPLPSRVELIELGAVEPALERLAGRAAVVLASGDPGFFGIVRLLRERGHVPRVLPAPSSVAALFARLGRPWDDVTVVSAHGRALRPALNVCRARPATAVLTAPGAGPAEIGAGLAGWPRTLVVAEDLGGPGERLTTVPAAAAAERVWHPLNVVLCLRDPDGVPGRGWYAGGEPVPAAGGWARPDDEFTHRAGMVTKSEVRALVLARLGPRPGELVWDVGAGSGSVAVECAALGAAVLAVERRSDDRRAHRGQRGAARGGRPGGGGRGAGRADRAAGPGRGLRRWRRPGCGVRGDLGRLGPGRRGAGRAGPDRPDPGGVAGRWLYRRRGSAGRVPADPAARRRGPAGRHQPDRPAVGGANPMIALFAVTAAGRAAAAEVAAALDATPAELAELPRLWPQLDGAVFFLAAGATVRMIAPLLADKHTDPGVVCVDEARRFAVALTGGHGGGANALAARVAAVLGAQPVITTASDATGSTGLDELVELLDAQVDGDLAAAGTALLDGAASVHNPLGFPLPPLPPTRTDPATPS